jgi:hypothetical protein
MLASAKTSSSRHGLASGHFFRFMIYITALLLIPDLASDHMTKTLASRLLDS